MYVVYSANNFAMQHKRKTISGQDVLDAMKEMEFERFVEPLKRSLEGMRPEVMVKLWTKYDIVQYPTVSKINTNYT